MIWLGTPIAFVCPLSFLHIQISDFFAFDTVTHAVLSYKNVSSVLSFGVFFFCLECICEQFLLPVLPQYPVGRI